MSWAFVLLAGVLVIGFFIKVGTYETIEQHDARPGQKGDGGTAGRTAVSTSTFSGFDREQQPFQISAEQAVRDSSDPVRCRSNRSPARSAAATAPSSVLRPAAAVMS